MTNTNPGDLVTLPGTPDSYRVACIHHGLALLEPLTRGPARIARLNRLAQAAAVPT